MSSNPYDGTRPKENQRDVLKHPASGEDPEFDRRVREAVEAALERNQSITGADMRALFNYQGPKTKEEVEQRRAMREAFADLAARVGREIPEGWHKRVVLEKVYNAHLLALQAMALRDAGKKS